MSLGRLSRRVLSRGGNDRRPRRAGLGLGTKLGAVILVCMLASMAVAAVIFVRQAEVEAESKARLLAHGALDDFVARIRIGLQQTFTSLVKTDGAVITLWHHGIRERRYVDALLRGMLEDDPDLFGAWMVPRSDAFEGHDVPASATSGSTASDRHLIYWRQNGEAIEQDVARSAAEPRFGTSLDSGRAFLSEPYLVQSNGERVAAVSFSQPTLVDDQMVGAIGIDMALRPLVEQVAAAGMPPGATSMIVSYDGVVVAADGDRVTETPLKAMRGGLAGELDRAEQLGGTVTSTSTPAGLVLVGWAPLTTLDRSWFVRVTVPVDAFAADAVRQQRPTIAVVLGILAMMMAAVLIALRYFVTRPLGQIEAFVKTLGADGAKRACPGGRRTDEVGSIATALTAFQDAEQEVRRLRQADAEREARFVEGRRVEFQKLADHLAVTVQSVAGLVDATSRKIMQRAETMAAAAVAAAERTKTIGDASAAADASVGTVDFAASALRNAIDRIANEMSDARRIASDAAARARLSGAVTEALSSQAARIGEIVALISSIAQRTNMLALNATIEAARAGESGRGFAVVAQEVKGLASQTAAATADIGQQIKAMQATAGEAAAALRAIGEHVAAIDQISSSVAGAVSEQDEATGMIGRSVENAVVASHGVSTAIAEVERVASLAGDAAADMLVGIAQLTDEIGRLDEEVRSAIGRIRAA